MSLQRGFRFYCATVNSAVCDRCVTVQQLSQEFFLNFSNIEFGSTVCVCVSTGPDLHGDELLISTGSGF